MQEEKYDLGGDGGMRFEKGRFGKWLENFWYHYKWHTLISLFVIIVLTVCTVQICKRPEYDVHIVYAGSGEVRGSREGNDISEYEKICKSLNEAAEDFDGNGKLSSSLETIYLLSEKEILEKQESVQGTTNEFNYDRTNEDDFRNRFYYSSDVYIFLISESIYREYQVTEQGISMFSPIRDLAKDGSGAVFLDDSAVYLSSTEFGKLPGLCDLPEDTLITLRSVLASTTLNKDRTQEEYENARTVVANMINYGK